MCLLTCTSGSISYSGISSEDLKQVEALNVFYYCTYEGKRALMSSY